MARNFDLRAQLKNRRVVVRLILGVMLLANLVAAAFVFHPLGGSPEDLARDLEDRQRQLTQQLQRLERTRSLVGKVQQARVEGDTFLEQSAMSRRTRAISSGLAVGKRCTNALPTSRASAGWSASANSMANSFRAGPSSRARSYVLASLA